MHKTTLAFYALNAADYANLTQNVPVDDLMGPFVSRLPEKALVLDVGSGSGRDSQKLSALGHRLISLDASLEMLLCASRVTTNQLVCADMAELPFRDVFDGIWAMASLLHIPKSKMVLSLKGIRRIMRLGGVLFISFKRGQGELVARDGRFFNYYDSEELSEVVEQTSCFDLIDTWESPDPGKRLGVTWTAMLLRAIQRP